MKECEMKIQILDIIEFLKTIDDEWYIEDDGILDEYMDEGWEKPLDPRSKITIDKDDIWIMYQGDEHHEDKEFLTEFKKWKTGRDSIYIVLEIDKDKLDEVTETLKKITGVKDWC
jgi:hypothetical protein